jgi:phosphoglycerol geranylgeranyltransferase
MSSILTSIIENKQQRQKSLAVLVDPDNYQDPKLLDHTIATAIEAGVDYFLVGGSLLVTNHFEACVKHLKRNGEIPVIIFPGSPSQVSPSADGILFLSLISGRNPETLIGAHVAAAPAVKAAHIEVLPTGYMLIDSGAQTSASYISNTTPIPHDKDDIAACTALAGQYLGLRLIYLDGGSGAQNPVSASMIKKVKSQIDLPLIIGGGIRDVESARKAWEAGADIVVVGTAIEKDPNLIRAFAQTLQSI